MAANSYPHLVFANADAMLSTARLQAILRGVFAVDQGPVSLNDPDAPQDEAATTTGPSEHLQIEEKPLHLVLHLEDYLFTFWFDDEADLVAERYVDYLPPTARRRRLVACTTMIDMSGAADEDGAHAAAATRIAEALAAEPGVFVFAEEAKRFVGLDYGDEPAPPAAPPLVTPEAVSPLAPPAEPVPLPVPEPEVPTTVPPPEPEPELQPSAEPRSTPDPEPEPESWRPAEPVPASPPATPTPVPPFPEPFPTQDEPRTEPALPEPVGVETRPAAQPEPARLESPAAPQDDTEDFDAEPAAKQGAFKRMMARRRERREERRERRERR